MKSLKVLSMCSLILAIIYLASCSSNEKSNTEMLKEVEKQIITPPIDVCYADMGVLLGNTNSNSVTKPNELTKMLELLQLDSCEQIEISYIRRSPSGYADMPRKLVYDKYSKRLQHIFTRTNVIENFDNVDKDAFISYLKKGKVNLWEVGDYSTDFTKSKPEALGLKPVQNELNRSVKEVVDYVKANAHDPESVSFKEWSEVTALGSSWVVKAVYEANNAFGQKTRESAWFYIENGKVIKTKLSN